MKKIILFTGLVLTLIACNKDKSVEENNGGSSQGNTVYMKNSVFSPASLRAGIPSVTVTWINDDNMVHTVTSDNGSFDSGDIAPGGRFSYTFTTTGTYNYHCIHHSGMAGAIIVAGIR